MDSPKNSPINPIQGLELIRSALAAAAGEGVDTEAIVRVEIKIVFRDKEIWGGEYGDPPAETK